MRRNSAILAVIALVAGTASAMADGLDLGQPVPEHVREARYADSQPQPYATTWGDEAAQRLGVRDGRWEVFQPARSDAPSLNAGIDSGRPMLHLSWH